jgi:hypothetical protein
MIIIYMQIFSIYALLLCVYEQEGYESSGVIFLENV